MTSHSIVGKNEAFPQLYVGRDEAIIDPDIPIIDAHHHLFTRPSLRYLLDEYLADAASGHKIIATVYMEIHAFSRAEGPEALRPLGEIEFANGVGAMCASGNYGHTNVCAGIVGYGDLRLGDEIAHLLDRALATAPERFRGIRQIAIEDPTEAPYKYITNRPPAGLFTHPNFRAAFRHLVDRHLTFDAAVFHHQLPEIIDLADAFPDGKIVINHCGHAMAMDMDDQTRADVFKRYRELMFDAARRPNIYCKVGGLGMPFWGFKHEERKDPIGYEELAEAWRPYVETTIEAFGPTRCMMESNYPQDGRSAGFVPLWNALKYIVRSASAEEKASLFHTTATDVYRLELPAKFRKMI